MDRFLKKLFKQLDDGKIDRDKFADRLKSYMQKDTDVIADKMSRAGSSAKGESIIASKLGAAYEELKKYGAATQEVLGPLERLKETQQLYADATNAFFKAGYTGKFISFADAISSASKASLDLNGNLDGATRVMEAFRSKSLVLGLANKKFTEQLMSNSVVLERAGFDMEQYTEIVDSAAFAFNNNGDQINKLTATLVNVQKEIPVSGRELSENFRIAQRDFAYSADQLMDNFIGLQKLSVETGISFDTLTSKFGDSLDSFQGSADMAGKLNQILGKSVFNSIELLNMTEEERANKIRTAIMNSGRSVEQMGKFELKALAGTLGFTTEETRKFLRGDLKLDEMKKLKDVQAKDPAALRSAEVATEMQFLRDRIKQIRPELDNLRIGIIGAAGRGVTDTAYATTRATLEGRGINTKGMTDQQTVEAFIGAFAGTLESNTEGVATLSGLMRKDSPFIEATTNLVESVQNLGDGLAKVFGAESLESGLGAGLGGASKLLNTAAQSLKGASADLKKTTEKMAGMK